MSLAPYHNEARSDLASPSSTTPHARSDLQSECYTKLNIFRNPNVANN